MRNVKEVGMPSGEDYGYCMKYGEIDNGDYIPAIFHKKGEYDFTFVVERKDGKVIYSKRDGLIYEPIFGVDQGEWMNWIESEVFPAVNEDISNNSLFN